MSWESDNEQRLSQFPAEVREAHRHSSNHRAEVLESARCGCFCCGAMFQPAEILDWVDEDDDEQGRTALCPRCGIDSVMGDKSGFPVSEAFLNTMKAHWF